MRSRPVKLNFEKIEQVIQFEISRFPFADSDRKRELRKVYRDLEASLRNALRLLEDLEESKTAQSAFARTASSIETAIRLTCHQHEGRMGRDLTESLNEFCQTLSQISAEEFDEERLGAHVSQMLAEFTVLKQSLGQIHKM